MDWQGLDKKQTVEKHGKDQVMIWRRSYTTPPPLLSDDRCEGVREANLAMLRENACPLCREYPRSRSAYFSVTKA